MFWHGEAGVKRTGKGGRWGKGKEGTGWEAGARWERFREGENYESLLKKVEGNETE